VRTGTTAPRWVEIAMREAPRWPPIIGALSVLVIVFAVVYSSVTGAHQRDVEAKAHAAERGELLEIVKGLRGDNVALESQLIDMKRQNDAIAANQKRLIEYFTGLGYDIPAELIPAGVTIRRSSGDGDSSSSTTRRIVRRSVTSGTTSTPQRSSEGGGNGPPSRSSKPSHRSSPGGRGEGHGHGQGHRK